MAPLNRVEYQDGQTNEGQGLEDLWTPNGKGRKIGLPAEPSRWYGGMVTYLSD